MASLTVTNSCVYGKISKNMSFTCQSDETIAQANEHINFCEDTDLIARKITSLKELIQCRSDIFRQRKEKFQNFVDGQIKIMEKKKDFYLEKNKELLLKSEEFKAVLAQFEHNKSNLKANYDEELLINEKLKEGIKKLQSASEVQDNEFSQTSCNYSTVVHWYEDFLNLIVDLDKENHNIVNLNFSKYKNCDTNPHMKIEILDNDNFKVLTVHPSLARNGVIDSIIGGLDLIVILCDLFKQLTEDSNI